MRLAVPTALVQPIQRQRGFLPSSGKRKRIPSFHRHIGAREQIPALNFLMTQTTTVQLDWKVSTGHLLALQASMMNLNQV